MNLHKIFLNFSGKRLSFMWLSILTETKLNTSSIKILELILCLFMEKLKWKIENLFWNSLKPEKHGSSFSQKKQVTK